MDKPHKKTFEEIVEDILAIDDPHVLLTRLEYDVERREWGTEAGTRRKPTRAEVLRWNFQFLRHFATLLHDASCHRDGMMEAEYSALVTRATHIFGCTRQALEGDLRRARLHCVGHEIEQDEANRARLERMWKLDKPTEPSGGSAIV